MDKKKTASEIAEETFPYIEGDSAQGRYNIFTRRNGFCIGYDLAKAHSSRISEALEEISEVTVIQGNYKEAFEIVQNIVNHIIKNTER